MLTELVKEWRLLYMGFSRRGGESAPCTNHFQTLKISLNRKSFTSPPLSPADTPSPAASESPPSHRTRRPRPPSPNPARDALPAAHPRGGPPPRGPHRPAPRPAVGPARCRPAVLRVLPQARRRRRGEARPLQACALCATRHAACATRHACAHRRRLPPAPARVLARARRRSASPAR